MKIKVQSLSDVVSIEKIATIIADEDDDILGNTGELESGTYAIDSTGRVWREVESVSGLMEHFTEHDGIRRRRAKRS